MTTAETIIKQMPKKIVAWRNKNYDEPTTVFLPESWKEIVVPKEYTDGLNTARVSDFKKLMGLTVVFCSSIDELKVGDFV